MALITADRVADTSQTTGTGSLTLDDVAPTGYRTVNAVTSVGDTIYYCASHRTLDQWEVGLGTIGGSGTTLARTTVLASSNSGSAVSFSAGLKDIIGVFPASVLSGLYGPGGTDVAIADGGTGASTAEAAFNNLSPTTTRGDLIYRNATTNTRLAASTSGYLLQTNGAATDPTWAGFLQSGSSAVTRAWQDKLRETVSVLDFIPVAEHAAIRAFTSTTDVASYIALAVTAAATLRCNVYFPSGRYKVGSTTTITSSYVRLVGDGATNTIIYRDFASGPTFSWNAASNAVIIQCGMVGFGFTRNTATSLGSSNVAHIKITAGLHVLVADIRGDDVVEGVEFVGGALINIDQVSLVGDYAATDKARYGVKFSKLASPGSGATALPSYIRARSVWCSGSALNGFAYPLWILGGEFMQFDDCYFGQAKIFNVLIEQGSDNALILDITFGVGSYIDGADKSVAGDGIYITGNGILSGETWNASARSGGNGDGYIGNVNILCTVKGQVGDGRDGIRIDGTARGGTYSIAPRGITIAAQEISAWNRHGINAGGGLDIRIIPHRIRGNNFNNSASGSGIVLGATCTRPVVGPGRVGGDAFGAASTNYQVYGIDIVAGCTDAIVFDTNVKNNVTAGVRDNGTTSILSNNPDGNDDGVWVSLSGVRSEKAGGSAGIDTKRTDAHGSAQTIGTFTVIGKDSASNTQTYGVLSVYVADHTSASEDALWVWDLATAGTVSQAMILSGAALTPAASDLLALGSTALQWSDLFLAEGGVINWDNGDVTITQTNNVLSFAGASTRYEFDSNLTPASSDGAALGTSALMFSDLFLASGAVVNFNNGDVTITHSANLLAFGGASSGYTFDALATITSAGASALAVGANGATNPVLKIDASAASVATGVAITGAAAAARVALAAISSGTDEGLSIDAKGAGTIRLGATSTGAVEFSRNAVPTSSDGAALGTTSLMWADLFLASGGVINWNNGDVTLTHSANTLTFAGASSGYTFDATLTISNTLPSFFLGDTDAGADAKNYDFFADSGSFVGRLINDALNSAGEWIRVVRSGTSPSYVQFSAPISAGTTGDTATWLKIAAGTTAKSQINLPVSTAPTSPVDGDIWRQDNTDTGLKIRVNGVTKTVTLA